MNINLNQSQEHNNMTCEMQVRLHNMEYRLIIHKINLRKALYHWLYTELDTLSTEIMYTGHFELYFIHRKNSTIMRIYRQISKKTENNRKGLL